MAVSWQDTLTCMASTLNVAGHLGAKLIVPFGNFTSASWHRNYAARHACACRCAIRAVIGACAVEPDAASTPMRSLCWVMPGG